MCVLVLCFVSQQDLAFWQQSTKKTRDGRIHEKNKEEWIFRTRQKAEREKEGETKGCKVYIFRQTHIKT